MSITTDNRNDTQIQELTIDEINEVSAGLGIRCIRGLLEAVGAIALIDEFAEGFKEGWNSPYG
ncbi:hypothetical protein [Kordiimonas laminariae]|uniref:hypothetical protein n=1 Tax=Kordiimonas laminariae TaxID=2917717 RepID=UPI001FF539BD|nr:hypothetical protein [Kordiimonas laminariae]MCK0069468.1 hypothetical protein [Kordiimonas laminariae]